MVIYSRIIPRCGLQWNLLSCRAISKSRELTVREKFDMPVRHSRFYGAFTKLLTATSNVCLSVRMEQHRSHMMDFHEMLLLGIFRNFREN
jgi:hypothetical protein